MNPLLVIGVAIIIITEIVQFGFIRKGRLFLTPIVIGSGIITLSGFGFIGGTVFIGASIAVGFFIGDTLFPK